LGNEDRAKIVIFVDESAPRIRAHEIKQFISRLSSKREKNYSLKELFNFPRYMRFMEIKDWQLLRYMRGLIFTKNKDSGYRLSADKKLTFFFITCDLGFIEHVKDGFMNYSKRKKIPRDINLDKKNKIFFRRSFRNPRTKKHDSSKVMVHIIYILSTDKRPGRIKEVFKKIESLL